MKKIRVYLDNCCFNRPYDDQSSIMIRLETEAKLYIQQKVKEGEYELVWSYMLDYENEFNPNKGKKKLIEKWEKLCKLYIKENENILSGIEILEKIGVHGKDTVHIACAVNAEADFFITTDYKLIKNCTGVSFIQVINPVDFIKNIEEKNEND